jgi:diguanylate cyclase (GGDEF)-like protein
VLTEIAGLLKTFRRGEQDCAARYGGEEFALLLPAIGTKDALLLAERIRKRVAALTIHSQRGSATVHASAHVTISVGVTTLRGPAIGHCRQIVDAADAALYRAKRAGGNRTKYQHLSAQAPTSA